MPTEVIMPQMGESIFEGTITKWLKKPGDAVHRDEPLFEISTDKVDSEIPAPVSGVLAEIKVEAGKTVAVNTVLALIAAEGESVAPASQPEAAAEPQTEPAAKPSPVVEAQPSAIVIDEPAPKSAAEVRSSPLVRRLAEENGVDLRYVPGTGQGGRVTKEDILAYVERRKAAPASAPSVVATPAPAPTPAAAFVGQPGVVEPMSVMRQKIAEHMVASKRTSAHVYSLFDVDMTRVVRLRAKNKDKFQQATGLKLSYTPFFVRAVAQALRALPILNSSVEGDSIHYKRDINIGMAVALDWGLIVPVIKRADELSFVGLQRAVNDLAARARSKSLKPADVQDGTFTITNPGVFGARFGMPIINQPQVGILDIGGIFKTPVVVADANGDDVIAIRSMMSICLGFDHRLIDGAVADQFMIVVKKTLENWSEPLF